MIIWRPDLESGIWMESVSIGFSVHCFIILVDIRQLWQCVSADIERNGPPSFCHNIIEHSHN